MVTVKYQLSYTSELAYENIYGAIFNYLRSLYTSNQAVAMFLCKVVIVTILLVFNHR